MRTAVILLAATATIAALAPRASAQSITITTTTLPNWTKGQTYGGTALGVPILPGGTGALLVPLSWSVTGGALPTGITLNAFTGTLSGTPTAVGSYTFTIQVKNAVGATASQGYTVVINGVPVIDQSSLPDAKKGRAYSTTITVSNGTFPLPPPLTPFSISQGSLPPGLALGSATGTISGTPTAAGTYAFRVRVVDAAAVVAQKDLSIRVRTGPDLAASGHPVWTVSRAGFELRITASGGEGPLTFNDPTGVPPGLATRREGDVLILSGTPTELGTFPFSVTVRDSGGAEASGTFPVRVNPPPRVTTDSLPGATVGAEYRGEVEAQDGAAEGPSDYSWRIVSTTAGWLGIDAGTGVFTGAPGGEGGVDVTVEVTDLSGATARQDLAITVNPALSLEDLPFPLGLPEEAYSAEIPIRGGTPDFLASLVAGALPDGLAIDGTRIAGTPAAPGHSTFQVGVTDRWGAEATLTTSVTIGRKLPVDSKLPEAALAASAREAFVFDVIAGTTLSLKLKVPFGAALVEARLRTFDGEAIDVVPYLSLARRSLAWKKVPVPETGRVALVIENVGGAVTKVSGKVSGRAPKGGKEKVSWGPTTSDRAFPFSALKGARITIAVKAAGRDVPAAALVSLTGPDGSPVDAGPFLRAKRGGFRIARLVAALGGDYLLTVRPDGVGTRDGTLKVRIRLKSPKEYAFTYPGGD